MYSIINILLKIIPTSHKSVISRKILKKIEHELRFAFLQTQRFEQNDLKLFFTRISVVLIKYLELLFYH